MHKDNQGILMYSPVTKDVPIWPADIYFTFQEVKDAMRYVLTQELNLNVTQERVDNKVEFHFAAWKAGRTP